MEIDTAFEKIKKAFPDKASFQGTHFKYAYADGVVLIENRRWDESRGCPVFFYWLQVGSRFRLIHAAQVSKLKRLQTIGASFSPGDYGEQ